MTKFHCNIKFEIKFRDGFDTKALEKKANVECKRYFKDMMKDLYCGSVYVRNDEDGAHIEDVFDIAKIKVDCNGDNAK